VNRAVLCRSAGPAEARGLVDASVPQHHRVRRCLWGRPRHAAGRERLRGPNPDPRGTGGDIGQPRGGSRPTQRLARSRVQLLGNGGELLGVVVWQVGPLREVLAQQAIGVLVAGPLPRAGLPAEVHGMPSALVISACIAISAPWSQLSDRRSCFGSAPRWRPSGGGK
jgi:hypothetical protein